jgi:uroporphyrinogen decarboxylase
MNKREAVLSLLDGSAATDYVPAAFFIHFPPDCHRGQEAIDKHLSYFRYTDMDFVKIQYEFGFPHRPEIQSADDWSKMPSYRREYFQDQLDVVAGLVKAAKGEALVVQTLYSAFMSARSTSSEMVVQHLEDQPQKAKLGMEIITDSILWFVRECVKLGVDGFYASTQGGEADRFTDPSIFSEWIKPYDLAVMEEIDGTCSFNILHVCDYHSGYADLTPFLDYPGDVVNCPLEVGSRSMTPGEASRLFDRPYMGGLDRHGVIATGSQDQIGSAVKNVLHTAPENFILGADCTLPGDVNWDNIKTAITIAHGRR